MLAFLHAAGGIAILLFGVRFLRKGLDRMVGERLDVWLGRVTDGPARAAAAGAAIGVVVPSSTSLSLLAVSFVRDGRLMLHSAMALVLGAFVGITVPVHLVAFNIFRHAPILALVGVLLFQGTRRTASRALGQVLLGVSFLFLGVTVVSNVVAGMADNKDVLTLLELVAGYPWLVALAGAGLTVLAQSSTATITVLLALGLTDPRLMSDQIGIPFVAGANVGLAVTLLMAGWRQPMARRLGLGVLMCRLAGAVVVLLLLAPIVRGMDAVGGTVAARIAGAHTAFNALVALGAIPLVGLVAALTRRIVPDDDARPEDQGPQFLNQQWPDDPAVALAQSKREIGVMSATVTRMLTESWEAIKTGDESMIRRIRAQDDRVDRLNREIKRFLTRQVADDLPPELERGRARQLRFLSDLETVGDVIDRNLVEVATKRLRKGVRFSEEGWQDLKSFYEATRATLELAAAVFVAESADLAHKLLNHKARVRDLEISLREKHFERLQSGHQESFETTDLHLEILSQFKHINHLMAGVAYTVLEHRQSPEAARAAG